MENGEIDFVIVDTDTSAHWYSQIPIFLGSSSWTVFEVEENFMQSLSTFYYFFRDKNSF